MDKKIKQRLGDGKINTSFEMIENLEEKLWESNPMEALRHERIEMVLNSLICTALLKEQLFMHLCLFLVWLLLL